MRVELLTNRTGAAERRRIADGLAAGEVDIVVGTHALIYGEVEFAGLGVAVIDEQHRFGVEQRALLRGQWGEEPDVLVMTATPIPRTAAMLVYGDLDKSELREMPPGRTPVHDGGGRAEPAGAHRRVRAPARPRSRRAARRTSCARSSRARAQVEAKAATEELERLGDEELAGLRLGLLHGQMPARGEGGGRWTRSAPASSTCSSRRP